MKFNHLILGVTAFTALHSLTAYSEVLTEHGTLMGKDLSASQISNALPSNLGVNTETRVQFLGTAKSLMDASVEAIPVDAVANPNATSSPAPSNSLQNGTVLATTDWYIGGTRVWNGTLNYANGGLVYSGGIAPTQIPFPLVVYPVGPLILEVDAGVSFEGTLGASLTPGISLPIQDSTLTGKLQAELAVAGYVEGYAKLLIVRAGVGGEVNFVDGTTGVEATLYLNKTPPLLGGFGKVVLLNGHVYGFVDTSILFGNWSRLLSEDFFKWPGKCYAFGVETCSQ